MLSADLFNNANQEGDYNIIIIQVGENSYTFDNKSGEWKFQIPSFI